MTQQSHCWAYTPRKPELKQTLNKKNKISLAANNKCYEEIYQDQCATPRKPELKETHVPQYHSTVYNSQDMEAT